MQNVLARWIFGESFRKSGSFFVSCFTKLAACVIIHLTVRMLHYSSMEGKDV